MNENKNITLTTDARSNFGAKGWWIIFYSFLSFFFYGVSSNSSLNVVIPIHSAEFGWDAAGLLALSTPATLIAVVVCLFVGRLVKKIGLVNAQILLLLLSGLSVIGWGWITSFTGYAIILILLVTFCNGIFVVAGNMLITNWFPRKKGIAIGWATMGLNVSSAVAVPMLTFLIGRFAGVKGALTVFGCAFFVYAIITKLFVKDYPEQMGAYPDNDPDAVRKTEKRVRTGWTIPLALRHKETWLMGIGNGIYGMTTVAFTSQFIPVMISRGMERGGAVTMLTVASIVGMVGSYVCGFVDQKFGARRAAMLYGVWVAVGLLMFLLPGTLPMYLYIFMLGFSIGGSNNYPPSMTAQIFGRDGAVVVFPVVYFISGCFRALCYAVMALSLSLTGGYSGAYVAMAIFALIAVGLFYMTRLAPIPDPIGEAAPEASAE